MKFITLFFLLLTSLSAYTIGSTIDDELANSLKLDNNKLYIIDFFASWCSSCEKELPDLNRFNTTLDTKKYALIGIDIDKNIDNATNFQTSLHVNFRVINDTNQHIVSAFKPLGMPSLYIVQNKKVLHVIVGARDSIDKELTSYLKGIHE